MKSKRFKKLPVKTKDSNAESIEKLLPSSDSPISVRKKEKRINSAIMFFLIIF